VGPGGGAKTYYFSLKNAQNILFSFKKVEKHITLASQGGQEPPLALPCGRPCACIWLFHKKTVYITSQYFQKLF